MEEEDKMKMDVLELREQKKIGARPSNKSVAQDYRAQMTAMNNEVHYHSSQSLTSKRPFRYLHCLKERVLQWLLSLAAPALKIPLNRTGFVRRMQQTSLRMR